MERPGTLGVCVSDASGLSLSTRGSLKSDVASLGSQLLTLCSQLEPSSGVIPEVYLLSDNCKYFLFRSVIVCPMDILEQAFRATMAEVSLTIEFSGGCEFLVGNKKEHKVSFPCDEDFVTVADVIRHVKDVMLKVRFYCSFL
uniref:Ubiquitin-related modifier 1 n=1 Tax=Angiostrongylus cantonensis TaxID=6313 RepID=A0A0K0DKM3_ANGCA